MKIILYFLLGIAGIAVLIGLLFISIGLAVWITSFPIMDMIGPILFAAILLGGIYAVGHHIYHEF
jgi:hypothetical protein